MTQHTFTTPQPVELYVEIGRGSVEITATATDRTDVEVTGPGAEAVSVREDDGRISIVAPRERGRLFGVEHRHDVRVTLPESSQVAVRTGSADIVVLGTVATGRLRSGSGTVRLERSTGPLTVETGSGDIHVSEAADTLQVRSGSGDVAIGTADKAATISTGSGHVRIETAAGAVAVKTGSGDLAVGESTEDVSLATASGDLVVTRARRGRISAQGASGAVRVGIPGGTPVWTDISTVTGRIHSTVTGAGRPEEGGDHVEVRARTVTGDVVLAEA